MVTIEPKAVEEKLRKGGHLVILDVREPFEYEYGHIPGAINYPVSRLLVGSVNLPKDAQIVTVCEHGIRSEAARKALEKKGFSALSMAGGMSCWLWETENGS